MIISTNQYFRLLLTWVLRASKVLDKPQTRDLNKPGNKTNQEWLLHLYPIHKESLNY